MGVLQDTLSAETTDTTSVLMALSRVFPDLSPCYCSQVINTAGTGKIDAERVIQAFSEEHSFTHLDIFFLTKV